MNNTVLKLDTDRLDAIVELIDAQIEATTDYYLHNTDNPVADYVAWGWKEGDLDDCMKQLTDCLSADFSNDYDAIMDALRTKGDIKQQLDYVFYYHCNPERLGIERNDNDLYSMSIGEIEDQLSDDIVAIMATLTDIERDYVECKADGYVKGDYVYIDLNYNRWAMLVDADGLVSALLND